MKSFKNLVSEVAQPKPEEEKKFKAQHEIDIAPHPVSTEFQHKGVAKPKAKRKADQEGDANYDKAYTAESVEDLDEVSDQDRLSARKIQRDAQTARHGIARKPGESMVAYLNRAKKHKEKMQKEEVELDEDVTKMSHGRLKWHMNTGVPHGSFTKDEMKKERDRRMKYVDSADAYKKAKPSLSEAKDGDGANIVRDREFKGGKFKYKSYPYKSPEWHAQNTEYEKFKAKQKAMKKEEIEQIQEYGPGHIGAIQKMLDKERDAKKVKATTKKEEVGELDEISKKTLGSYVKKASYDAASNAAKFGANQPDKKGGSAFVKAHNRLRGIDKATDRLTKEEFDLEEKKISKGMQAYIDISNKKADATSKEVKGSIERVAAAMRARRMKKEEVELDEADVYSIKNTKTGQIYHNSKYPIDKNTQVYKKIKSAGGDHKHAAIHKNGKLVQEEVEQLDELSPKTLSSYVKKARKSSDKHFDKAGMSLAKSQDAGERAYKADTDRGYDYHKDREAKHDQQFRAHDRIHRKRETGIDQAKRRMGESVEQLDELSPNTLNSYVKKSAGNMAAHTAIAAAQASSSMGKSTPDVKRKIANRMKGIAGASNRLADKANMAENWQEEIPMMMRQLEFIAYAAEEIMDYVEMAGDPEEWFQNKISGIHQSMLSMYAYAQGGRRAGYGFDEEVELDEAKTKITKKSITRALQNVKAQPKEKVTLKKAPWEKTEELVGGQKKLDHNKNGKIDAHDFHLMRKKKKNEEVEQIDELSQDKLQSYHAKAALDLRKKREKLDKGTLTMKDLKKGQNRVTGLNRAANKMEGVESPTQMLDETFKQGVVKLKDGGSVVLKKEDADLLNQMFKDLSAANRKKMQEVAMKDKAGFEEILGFAREAL
jgi:hypothetical protein